MGEPVCEFFLPLQYGAAVPGGAEAVIHAARAFSDARPDSLVLQADISNAFNRLLPNSLLRCSTGKHRTNTHNELRDACVSMAQDAGFIVHRESAAYCPIEEQTADFTMIDRSSGAVYICDVTVTDPISTRDPEARKGRGWAAREQADKKIKHYANRPETVGFFPLEVDTYGCPCAEVLVFLKLLADTAARRHFNADSKSYYAAKFLHQFRQWWSVALQRAQSVGLLLKLGEAAATENPPIGGTREELNLGDCFAVVEPFLEL
ncbi:unnamed protein product [Closterium sp. NIES-53]